MTNNQLTDNQLTKIIESAEAVISALAGTNEDVNPNNSTEMCRLYDWLNDNDAPPEVVLAMAREIQEHRKAAAEPVAFIWKNERGEDVAVLGSPPAVWDKFATRLLYAAPQPLHAEAPAPGVREQWIADVVEYLEGGLEADGELEAEGSIEAKRLLSRRASMLQESPKGAGAPQNCRSNENVQVVDRQSVDHVDGESCCGNSPTTPDGWIPVSERMPDPKSELRVCVYTPTEHKDIRYRFIAADLFKAVCGDATHWRYMTEPAAPKEVG